MKRILLIILCAMWRCELWANPSGLSVASGSAAAAANGSHLTITAANGAVLHWNSFNIGKGETTQFVQPSPDSIVLNTIGGTMPSQIWGHLDANGTVILANAYGFYFGPHSMIKVGGNFIATTTPLPPDFGAGAAWQFTVPPPTARIVNYGEIQAGSGHSLFLISADIENHGALNAPGGKVGLYAGKEVLVSDRADGRGLSATVVMPTGSIDNTGSISASPGELALSEQVVNKQDVAPAAAAVVQDGAVELVAADITLGASSANGALNVNTAFQGANSISLQASDSITLNTGVTWNLSSSTGQTSGQLSLTAGNNITLNNNSQIVDANNWSMSLQAGANISLAGSSVIQSGAGAISMTAGQNITVASGAIRTTAGGAISLTATDGNINAGTKNDGYVFSLAGYAPSATLGQIATAAGGDVTLTAGGNITSSPTTPVGQAPGASGAYGTGDVTVTAGGQVLGNYTVANGTGTISAQDIGSSTRPVALSLVNGSWNLKAGDDIYLSEIRNPNGTFNAANLPVPTGEYIGNLDGAVPARTPFLFDYADDASASLTAGNAITLVGANLPRLANNQDMGPIYPPILDLEAGAGGITVDTPITLFPSAQGALHITTLNGGDLSGVSQQSTLTGITMSDSGLPGWSTFAQGHAITPLHLNDPNPDPVTLDISGDIDSFGLTVPTFADVSVAGNTYNFGFQGQNLSTSQSTDIAVAGSITYRGDLTSVGLLDPLPAILYNLTASGDPTAIKGLSYDAQTQTLTYIGQMTQNDEAFLLAPYRVVDGKNVPIPLTAAQQAAIAQLYTASQSASLGDQGLTLSGPGKFNIAAASLDLGISGGINVLAPDAALAAISPLGAGISVDVAGNLEMTASKIDDGGYLGAISLTVGGALDVGGELSAFGDPNSPKGIFTTSGGAVNVTCGGDINVDGSRIAAYDGGNVLVDSLTGSIDAGSGGSGYVGLQSLFLNRKGALTAIAATIPGSGILSTTVPGSPARAGSITIDAPHGDVSAGAGGIMLIPYNGSGAGGDVTINASPDVSSTGSGIINLGGGSTIISAVNVYGLIVTRGKTKISVQDNVSATVFSGLGASVSAGGNVSGTVISGGAVDVSGSDISAAVMGQSVSASGNTASASIGLPAASSVSQTARVSDETPASPSPGDDSSDDDTKKKNKKIITLAQKSSRVTVFLPSKKQ